MTAGPIWYIYPPAGGPGLGRYWRGYHLVRHWAKHGAAGLIVAPGYHHYSESKIAREGRAEIGGADYFFVRTTPYDASQLGRVKAMMQLAVSLVSDAGLAAEGRARPPQAIIYSSPYPFAFLGAWALAKRYRARLVLEVRDLWPLSLTDLIGTPGWHPFVLAAAFVERFAYARADMVVSLLGDAKAHMVAKGLAGEKFVWIPNGVDLAGETVGAGPETPLLARAAQLKREGRVIVTHIGNMSRSTHVEPLAKAGALLAAAGREDVRILIVGRGESETQVRAAAAGAPNVEFHPQVDKAEILRFLAQADIGYAALAAREIYRHGFSLNKLYDYMGAGLPVVFGYGLGETLVSKSGCGVEVPPDDPAAIAAALAALAEKTLTERQRMGAAGRAYIAAHHDYPALAKRYLEALAGNPNAPTEALPPIGEIGRVARADR
jgi:glycosyltransferase involved in cell wall biosynthesis